MSAAPLSRCGRARPKCPKWLPKISELGRKVTRTDRGFAPTAPTAPTITRAGARAGERKGLRRTPSIGVRTKLLLVTFSKKVRAVGAVGASAAMARVCERPKSETYLGQLGHTR